VATNRKLRAALLAERGFSKQRLGQLVKKRKEELPMSTELATYTIAHESGIDISKYLSEAETATVRSLIAQLKSAAPMAASSNGSSKRRRAGGPKPALVTVAGVDVHRLPGMTAAHAKEAREMAKVYSTLYVFENSLRDVIERVLRAQEGADWWEKTVPQKIQEKAAGRKQDEAKDPWHGKRGNRPIDYVDVSDLSHIVKHNWKAFSKIFTTPAWIEVLVTSDMNVSRRVVAHMNPLAPDDVKNLENAFRKYAKVLNANKAEIP
jgi:Swt1-like HEPN